MVWVLRQVAAQIDEFLGKLAQCYEGPSLAFVFVLDDPSGNSFIENP